MDKIDRAVIGIVLISLVVTNLIRTYQIGELSHKVTELEEQVTKQEFSCGASHQVWTD